MVQTATLHPSRIGCPSIPGTMKGIVLSVKGVESVNVRYEERSLDVTYDDSIASPEEIIKKIGQEMGLAMEIAPPGSKKEGGAADTCPM